MSVTALILTDGLLDQINCKTAHGLLLGTSRYNIIGVIDKKHAGQDAGLVISQKELHIPVFATVKQAIEQLKMKPAYCVIGIAPIGGLITDSLTKTIIEAVSMGINIVNGLHSYLADHPIIAPLATEKNITLIDIRKPKSVSELPMWTGKISSIKTPRIAVIGTDCAIGKRTTAGLLLSLCQQESIKAEMIYTGQTGWLQNMKYGFILDSTLNDFVAGEMERVIIQCVEKASPELIFIEGQSALRNPAGPCGAELLCSAGSKHVILQHSPARTYFICDTTDSYKIPDLAEEIALISHYGAQVIAITLNSKGIEPEQLPHIKRKIEEKTQLPVVYPREEGVNALLPILKEMIQ
jgi:uncharacterized NAD-dependent epimerase/dehydratase family protein